MKKIEKEIRGKFNNRKDLYEILAKISAISPSWRTRKRLSVLFTSGNAEGIDLQIRLHDREGEIVLKKGKHEGNSREENVIKIPVEQFIPSIFLIYSLGYKKAVVANCQDWVFKINDEEVKLTECDNKIFCWEIEANKKATSIGSLNRLAKTLGMKSLSEKELKSYWLWMKKYGNKKFDINKIEDIFNKYIKDIHD